MATLATRLTKTGNLLVNGIFDEITLTSSGNIGYRVTSDTVFVRELDEITIRNDATPGLVERRLLTSTQIKDQFDEFTGAPIVDSSLVLWLDGANPTSYPETGTTWFDLSGKGNNGTLTNGPIFSRVEGGVITLDGSNDYVTVANSTSLSISSAITVNCWVTKQSAPSGSGYPTIAMKNFSGSWTDGGWGINSDASTLYFWINNYSTNKASTSITATHNDYKMITGTFDGNNIRLYVNGSLVSNVAYVASITTTTNPLVIGAQSPSGSYYYAGNYATFQIYNRALSADEVNQNYNALKRRFNP